MHRAIATVLSSEADRMPAIDSSSCCAALLYSFFRKCAPLGSTKKGTTTTYTTELGGPWKTDDFQTDVGFGGSESFSSAPRASALQNGRGRRDR